MATPHTLSNGGMSEASIVVKISVHDALRKFRLHLSDVAPAVFADKIRTLLQVPAGKGLLLERYSDSSASYITLSTANPASYKQLYRAAKAKSKLRLKATITDATPPSNESLLSPPKAKPEVKASPAADPVATLSKDIGLINLAQPLVASASPLNSNWHVCCNSCDKVMLDAHYHCSTCDDGDYDLCEACVSSGVSCRDADHWLIKRNIQNGKVINSTTERLTPKPKSVVDMAGMVKQTDELLKKPVPGYTTLMKQTDELLERAGKMTEKPASLLPIPGSFATEPKAPAVGPAEPKRTCNSCVRVLPETDLVTCCDCNDYDLCFTCTSEGEHGHHPGHTFAAIVDHSKLSTRVQNMCAPGRAEHHWATCDGCDGRIQGVRHKCLDCPDWDYCSKCHTRAQISHPGHRFVPVYEKMNWSLPKKTRHYGIYCDGPLCKTSHHSSYIQGVRYKCAICHDTDFCANCEAHPKNTHNKTHPMLMFKTQVKNASISTVGEDGFGMPMAPMGDRRAASREKSILPTLQPAGLPMRGESCAGSILKGPPPAYDASRPVYQNRDAAFRQSLGKIPADVESKASRPVLNTASRQMLAGVPGSQLDAHFVRDTVSDGSVFPANTIFFQEWTLRNPGPHAWPVGVTLRNTGGDNMLNIDPTCPADFVELSAVRQSRPTTTTVQPGAEWRFIAILRSPQRAGKHISYWRAKAPDGTPFGHKLWCEIEVEQAAVQAPAAGQFFQGRYPRNMMQQTAVQKQATAKPVQIPVTSQVSSHNEGPVAVHRPLSNDPRASHMSEALRKAREMEQTPLAQFQEQLKTLAAGQVSTNAERAASPTVDVSAAPAVATEPKIESETTGSHLSAEDNADASNSTTSSQMVFPTLDKESPSSSTQLDAKEPAHEIIASAPASVRLETAPETVKTESVQESVGDELANDFDSVEFEDDTDNDDDDDDDEAFLTDEEYDILDASDEEIMNNGK